MVRDERPGAVRLARVINERPRYINLVVLLRIACEITATALLVDLPLRAPRPGLGADRRGRDHGRHQLRVDRRRPAHPRQADTPTRSRLAAALPLQAISVLLTPISRLLVLIGNALTPGRGFRNGPFASEIELREVVDLAQQRGVVADDERRMIQSVFELGDTPAREVMVPRTEMVWIESDKTAGQATSLAVRSGHSRIPVIGENVDDVVGVVYLKDLVERTYYSNNGGRDTKVSDGDAPGGLRARLQTVGRAAARNAARPQPHGASGRRVRRDRRAWSPSRTCSRRSSVRSPTSTTPTRSPRWRNWGTSAIRVSARLPIEDLSELYDIEFDEDLDVDTVGGLLALELGRVPLPGRRGDLGRAAAARRRRPRPPWPGADRHRPGQPAPEPEQKGDDD